ncbi:hypothetical protein [Enterococcus bulliens]
MITVLFFLIFSGYLVFINSNKLKEESYEKLTSYTESIKQQYQLQLASYDQAVTNLLSDKEFLLDLRTLSYLDTKEENVLALERSYLRITEKISNYSNLADFYRVNVITSKNDFLTNDIKLSSQRETAIEKVEALLQTADYNNGVFLVPNFQDVWGMPGRLDLRGGFCQMGEYLHVLLLPRRPDSKHVDHLGQWRRHPKQL